MGVTIADDGGGAAMVGGSEGGSGVDVEGGFGEEFGGGEAEEVGAGEAFCGVVSSVIVVASVIVSGAVGVFGGTFGSGVGGGEIIGSCHEGGIFLGRELVAVVDGGRHACRIIWLVLCFIVRRVSLLVINYDYSGAVSTVSKSRKSMMY